MVESQGEPRDLARCGLDGVGWTLGWMGKEGTQWVEQWAKDCKRGSGPDEVPEQVH